MSVDSMSVVFTPHYRLIRSVGVSANVDGYGSGSPGGVSSNVTPIRFSLRQTTWQGR
jgi:hypothetical protein